MDISNLGNTNHADALLHAAERALFDATARLQEALVLIDQQGLDTSEEMLVRVRQWSAMIRTGLDRLGTSRAVLPSPRAPGVLEA